MSRSKLMRAPGTRKRPKRATTPTDVLVLQLDSEKLSVGGLDQSAMALLPAAFSSQARLTFVRATTKDHLLERLAKLHGRTFPGVAVIGHSAEHGIRVASDLPFTNWSAFAGYLEPFKPQRLALVACRAGRVLPVDALFQGVPTLNGVLASPAIVQVRASAHRDHRDRRIVIT